MGAVRRNIIKIDVVKGNKMRNLDELSKEDFIYPKSRYYGDSYPHGLLWNANLQEFAHKVNYIAGLHSNGKLSSEQAYRQIENLWQQFKRLGIEARDYF
jgi:hypothetical protein